MPLHSRLFRFGNVLVRRAGEVVGREHVTLTAGLAVSAVIAARDSAEIIRLYDALRGTRRFTPPSYAEQRDAMRSIERALRAGDLVASRTEARGGTFLPNDVTAIAAAPAEPSPPSDPIVPVVALDQWVGIELVDREGAPVIGQTFRVTTADGTAFEGVLDGAGKARVKIPLTTTCVVSFPGLDESVFTGAGL